MDLLLSRRTPTTGLPRPCPHSLLVLEERDNVWLDVCSSCGEAVEPDYCTAPSGWEWTEVPDWGRCYWACLDCGQPDYEHRSPQPSARVWVESVAHAPLTEEEPW